MEAHKNAFTTGKHFMCLQLARHSQIVNTQKCLKINCVALTFLAHWQNGGERCGEMCWGVGNCVEYGEMWGRCGEMWEEVVEVWGEVRKDVGRGVKRGMGMWGGGCGECGKSWRKVWESVLGCGRR